MNENQYEDYIAIRDDFENKLRFIFPLSKIQLTLDVDEVKIKDFQKFVYDAPQEGTRVSKRTLFGTLEYEVFELENGDKISTV